MSRCDFCGADDSHHRLHDAVVERYLAGESVESLAEDYRCSADEIRGMIEAMRGQMRD